ncbi:PTS galactosamine/N-acetylgalactosamine transporter subunit IIA [Gilliamella sp. Gris1-4]|uniref:PTS galactosamine/N-acetylgalactosamine transporter subunit IIA n=1 Tax=Gilliamella sp. Gris1-4 TaxID=3120244 RepID=UPI00080EBDCE|nr:PTS galactosamine/N-acetylgalactosamine transporter subunit IIA [Gilliamella apicola]OCG35875.1 hypothetical protein A9G31_07600 [Gilliamella apicola]OCG65520.1 hypothetical protein A9G39_08980 [Gilliamella apicola]
MLGIILTGHGSFATGLYEAATQIIGQQMQFTAINFQDGMSSEQLEQRLNIALKQCDTGQGVVFLTDIVGGSPFRLAAMLSYQNNNIEVISGTNMPLLLEILLQREDIDLPTIRQETIENGKKTITSLWHEHQKKSPLDEVCSDGI